MSTLREKVKQEQNILKQIAVLDAKADDCISRLLVQSVDEAGVCRIFREYIGYKFSIDAEDFGQTDNLIELAKISFQKALKDGMVFCDQRNCHGVSESMDKKVLLITSIEQKLGFTFPVDEYIQIDTIADLARVTVPHLLYVQKAEG